MGHEGGCETGSNPVTRFLTRPGLGVVRFHAASAFCALRGGRLGASGVCRCDDSACNAEEVKSDVAVS